MSTAKVHRWLAIGVGLMVPVWFASGTILSFEPFPALDGATRLAALRPIEAGAIHVSPGGAVAGAGVEDVVRLRLVAPDGRARYVIEGGAGEVVTVDAVTGARNEATSAQQARAVAERLVAAPAIGVDGPLDFDRWTVHDRYRPFAPWWRVRFADPAGTALYVSARSGEVLQRTRARERAWNQVGALLHWLNLGTLRAAPETWRLTVRAVATFALALTLVGLVLGVQRIAQARRAAARAAAPGRQRWSPFRGLRKAHHLCGLAGGFIILWWLTSGWLSLDAGTLFSTDRPTAAQRAALRGAPLAAALGGLRGMDAAVLAGARELEFVVAGGEPGLIARGGDGGPIVRVPPQSLAALRARIEQAWRPAHVLRVEPLAADDAYALRGSPFPPGALRFVLDDAAATWVHVDAASGQIVSVMDRSRRTRRWLVEGLHTLDFPPLARAGSTWHVLLVIATSCGFAFALTGIVLAVRSLRRR
ncbi:MAG: PepSY domain-containing protein [Steroidobacteraceae bacterium]